MTLLLAINGWDAAPWLTRFQRLLPDRRVVAAGDAFVPDEVRYVAAWKHTPGSLSDLPRLQAIFSLGAGVDHLLSDAALPNVPILRVVDEDLTARMSEYVVMHCLMFLRQAWRYHAQQVARVWADDRTQPAARDVRVGVMGMGVLGKDAARKLAVVGFDVAGWSRSAQPSETVQTFAGAEELPAFLARTDILVVLMPLTPETKGMINGRLIAGLARNGKLGAPLIINAGRGGLQVEADILRALDDGALSSVTLDVFETEPLPHTSRLWGHPSAHITPHNAAMSDPEAVASAVVAQIIRHESGEGFRNLVNVQAGY